jgi:hypothetical protein
LPGPSAAAELFLKMQAISFPARFQDSATYNVVLEILTKNNLPFGLILGRLIFFDYFSTPPGRR